MRARRREGFQIIRKYCGCHLWVDPKLPRPSIPHAVCTVQSLSRSRRQTWAQTFIIIRIGFLTRAGGKGWKKALIKFRSRIPRNHQMSRHSTSCPKVGCSQATGEPVYVQLDGLSGAPVNCLSFCPPPSVKFSP